ncbi:ribosome 60S biogenesis N-terminal-domain-containing protein [Suillus clintonianus]|uniref:ribosome 60S biogenesis N-terminal-domain-containing protein n=1 Tax=Suillus clintonianus TaxID=1904413 RepID=UPI001B8776ED|nr:ribosome 60S biogenesis N-terminal-domain-containing protein [Suillus clintonianus]KAG2124689.1 ribosome 60S biogenesis N-terminal-domain-containing protein [Suillus clintonianus]
MPQSKSERPQKRAKPEQTSRKAYKFSNAIDVRRALQNQDQNAQIEALSALRSTLSVKSGEIVAPQDERLALVVQWMESSSGAHDVFEIWEGTNQVRSSSLSLLVSLLSSVLTLLSSHFPYHSHGIPIIKTLLSPKSMRKITSFISGSNELILVSLKLLYTISHFGGGRERKALFEAFPWDMKTLAKLSHMRRKGKGDAEDVFARPDIRTYYVFFILSFIDSETSSLVKSTFLEQQRDIFLSIFKGLSQDSYLVVRKVLEVCWVGLWSDPKVKRTAKIGLFAEITIGHLLKLYERAGAENADGDHIPADLVHHFLLAICTRPGLGICFKERGWYPRDTDADVVDEPKKGGKIYNKILSNILKSLKVNEDARQQELALKILAACPELVAGYWPAVGLTLEPRLSSKWIANIAFFGLVISQPVPVSSFLIPGNSIYQPDPPPLSTILESILPSVSTKMHFSKGLQSTSHLVQHCTALALARCLTKLSCVFRALQDVESALEEDETGQWTRRHREVEREARRRVPEFQVVVAFSQMKVDAREVKLALLGESAQRLLWLYHLCFPQMVAEARFDVGKLLQGLVDASQDTVREAGSVCGLHGLKQLHVLRLLQESDQFTWSGKVANSSNTYLHALLKIFCATPTRAVRSTLRSLLRKTLAESILFQEDPDEVDLWLDSFPTTCRGAGCEAPDGAALTDESDSVATFLDDCAQRCIRTPYRYLEALQDLLPMENSAVDAPSPLLMTVLEQFAAKLVGKLLTPSDALAITGFLRRLVFKLAGKSRDLTFLRIFSGKVDDAAIPGNLFSQYACVTDAIRREVSIMHRCFSHFQELRSRSEPSPSSEVEDFLTKIEGVPLPESSSARIHNAYELVDWLRFVEPTLQPQDILRIVAVVERFHSPALKDLFENLHPADSLMWEGGDLKTALRQLLQVLSFDWMFTQSSEADIANKQCREIMLECLFLRPPTRVQIEHAVCLVAHDICSTTERESILCDLLLLLSSIMHRAIRELSKEDVARLKEYVLLRAPSIHGLCMSEDLHDTVQEALYAFLDVSLDPHSEGDRTIVSSICTYWTECFRASLQSGRLQTGRSITLWLRYADPNNLLNVIDQACDANNATLTPSVLEVLEFALDTLKGSFTCASSRIPISQLLRLHRVLPHSEVLEEMIAVVVTSHLPPCHDGRPPRAKLLDFSLSQRYLPTSGSSQLGILPADFVSKLFQKAVWTESTSRIISGLVYTQSDVAKEFVVWFNSGAWMTIPLEPLLPAVHAVLDSLGGDSIDLFRDTTITALFERILPQRRRPEGLRQLCIRCICILLEADAARKQQLAGLLQKNIQRLAVEQFALESVSIAFRLQSFSPLADLVTELAERGLQWAVRHFSGPEGEDEEDRLILVQLTKIAKQGFKAKTHFVEPLLTTIIQNRLADTVAVDIGIALLQCSPLKPVVVNRTLQNILQHPQFFKLCGFEESSQRDLIIRFIAALFRLHPTNTCQPSHLVPLVRIYGGTISAADRNLLSIFRLYEAEKLTPISSILAKWSPSPGISISNQLEAVQNMDPIRMLRTCHVFPIWRRMSDEQEDETVGLDEQVYDPLFVTLLVAQMLAHHPPASSLEWVQTFRSNVFSLLIRCLSAKDDKIREASLGLLARVWKSVELSEMQEKQHALYIFNLLKNLIKPSSDGPPLRLPSFASLILSHALRGVFYPSNFIYPRTARFLLQRPELDVTDVPMLYGMLYGSSDDWKKERGWIVRFLSDGMMSTEDWKVLKRRHTWELLASLVQSSVRDQVLRRAVLEVLANLTCNAQATTSLVLKSSLLSWIEIQVQLPQSPEDTLAWLKILENILITANTAKLQRATNGQWRDALCRCLLLVLQNCSVPSLLILQQAARVTLRSSLASQTSTFFHLSQVLTTAIGVLEQLEPCIDFSESSSINGPVIHPKAPYHGHGLHIQPSITDPLRAWGNIVEDLWRASMTLEEKFAKWDALTGRLLQWRGIVGDDGSTIGEWARLEVVRISVSSMASGVQY